MTDGTVLIVTYGRSGSTLLMGLLNSIDGYLIRGENKNAFVGLYETWNSLQMAEELHGGRHDLGTRHPWFNGFSWPAIHQQMVALTREILCGDQQPRVYGFKEIRYVPDPADGKWLTDYESFAAYVDFLRTLLPNCHVLINTRDVEATLRSGWWSRNPDNSRRLIETGLEWFARYQSTREQCFSVTYEDLVGRSQRLQELFDFLGETIDEQAVNQVLTTSHSY